MTEVATLEDFGYGVEGFRVSEPGRSAEAWMQKTAAAGFVGFSSKRVGPTGERGSERCETESRLKLSSS